MRPWPIGSPSDSLNKSLDFNEKGLNSLKNGLDFNEKGLDSLNNGPDFNEKGLDSLNNGPDFNEKGLDSLNNRPDFSEKLLDSREKTSKTRRFRAKCGGRGDDLSFIIRWIRDRLTTIFGRAVYRFRNCS